MDEKILEEIKQKHLKADNTISLFFIGIDTIYFIIILVILGCGFKHFCSPKQMLFQMVLADIVYRILIIYINKFEYSLLNEIIFSFLSTLQFFLLNRILKRLFRDEYYDGGESLEIKSPYIFTFKICNLFIENQLYYSYILMACDLFKEVAKFFLFGLMLMILNSFDKFIKDEGIEVSREKEGIY